MPTFESHILRASIWLGILIRCRSIVGGEDDDRVVRDAGVLKRLHHFSNAPIELLHDVTANTVFRTALKLRSRLIRCVRIIVSVIKKKGLLSALANYLSHPLGIEFSQLIQRSLGEHLLFAIKNLGE